MLSVWCALNLPLMCVRISHIDCGFLVLILFFIQLLLYNLIPNKDDLLIDRVMINRIQYAGFMVILRLCQQLPILLTNRLSCSYMLQN